MPPMRPAFVPGGGGGGDASTVIWSVDFASEADHNFLTTAAVDIQGVEFTATNTAKAGEFQITGGKLAIQPNALAGYYASTDDSPQLSGLLADLIANGKAGRVYDRKKHYVWRMVLDATSPLTATGNQGVFCGLRQSQSGYCRDCHFGAYGNYYRHIKGGTYFYKDTLRSTAGGGVVPSVPGARSYAVRFGSKSFSSYIGAGDDTGGDAFEGSVVFSGYQNRLNTYNYAISLSDVDKSLMDLSAAGSQAYVSVMGMASGNYRWLIGKLELHEVG